MKRKDHCIQITQFLDGPQIPPEISTILEVDGNATHVVDCVVAKFSLEISCIGSTVHGVE